jgi:oligosaccharide repeat unit polymerase
MTISHPSPSLAGTLTFLGALVFAYTTIPDASPAEMACHVAIFGGFGLAVSFLIDLYQGGIRNVIRGDTVCLLALYFLTLVEFLFPQPDFDETVTRELTGKGLELVLLGFAGIATGRHFFPPKQLTAAMDPMPPAPATWYFNLLILAAVLGFMHRFVAVDFNPVQWWEATTGPRFSVPWARGRLGNWKALFNELALLLYLVPPLFAVIWNRRNELNRPSVYVAVFVFAFTLFSAFCDGTRNVFATYLATFPVAYILTSPHPTMKRVAILSGVIAGLLMFSTHHMLKFRNMGLKTYLEGDSTMMPVSEETLFVDYNLLAISQLTAQFPERFDYLGMEVPIWALARPIPRALWPGKPEGLSTGIEEALDAEGFTIATTYIGEAYMAFGILGVIAASLGFGALAGWWNRLGGYSSAAALTSVLYASGFFALAISMRSLLTFTTAALPTLALFVIVRLFPPAVKRAHLPQSAENHHA